MDTEVSVQDTFANTGNRRRSLRRRRPPQRYTPQLNAGGRQSYSYNGAVHLSYRGNRYLMNPKDGIVCLNLGGKPGVDNDPEIQYIDGVLNLNLAGRATEEQVPMDEEEIEEHLLGVALAHQYSLKKGIELFGDEAEKAATKELQQIDDMDTYIPVDPRRLSAEDRRKALSALFFLTRKRDGRLKGRKCAIGSKQRTYEGYQKSDGTSPTVSTDGVIMTSVIDAHEKRDVAIVDIPGAFLNTKNDEDILMCLRGKLVELMVRMNPKLYRPHVRIGHKGVPILYVKLNKALYGLLRAALLFYKKLRRELEAMGFVVNPYDPCVANRMVNGKQQTVTWHVDDLKISHEDKVENTILIHEISLVSMARSLRAPKEKVHGFLGMDLDVLRRITRVKVSMIKYTQENICTDFSKEDNPWKGGYSCS